MMHLDAESRQIVPAIVPVNLATAANNGDWVSLKNYQHLAVYVLKGAGASGEPPTITMKQATDVSGTSAKALNFTTIYTKNNADVTTVGTFTKVTQAAGNTYAPAAGDTQGLYLIEFNAEDLDTENGFDCVQVSIPDVGSTSQIGAAWYVLSGPRYTPPPSAIAD